MATLFERHGRWTMQVSCPDGRRRTLALGRVTRAAARNVSAQVQSVADAVRLGEMPSSNLLRWLGQLPDDFYARLAGLGLVEPRTQTALGPHCRACLAARPDLAGSSRVQYGLAIEDATTFFGADFDLRRVTPADADRFRAWLGSQQRTIGHGRELAPATVRKRMRMVKSLFRVAVRDGLLAENPFADQRTANLANRERLMFDDVLPAGKELPIAQDRCLDTVCYQEKAVRAVDRNLQELAAKHGRALPVITDACVATNEVKAARVKHAGAVQLGYAGGWQETSKSTRGAVVGVVVDDPARLGQTVWVRKNGDGGGEKSANGKPAKAGEKGQAKVTPLKERRALLERRRRALALEKFRAHLDSLGEQVSKFKAPTPAPALDAELVERIAPMLCLAATVGTAGNRGERDGSAVGWANVWKEFNALRRCSSDGASVLLVATWRLAADVLPVLIARLNPWGGLEHVDVAWEAAGKLADVLKQRTALEQAWSDAVLEITEPKSWAAEEAAGRKGKKTKGAK